MKIIILDFSTSEVCVYDYYEHIIDNAEDWFSNEELNIHNHKENDCHYMVVNELKQ